MTPLQSWLLVGGCLSVAITVAAAISRALLAHLDEDIGPDVPPRRPLGPSPIRSFEALEFERDVLATIDALPEVAA